MTSPSTTPLIDWPQVEMFLSYTGPDHDRVLVLFPPSAGDGPGIHFPITQGVIEKEAIERALRRSPQLSLGIVVNPPLPKPEGFGTKPEHLNPKTKKPKTWGASNAHIGSCWVLFLEGDGGLDDLEQQMVVHQAMPFTPTFTVKTGGKSLHFYWLLDEAVTPEEFRRLQQLLQKAASTVSEAYGADESIHSPAQVMRLPGGFHGGVFLEKKKKVRATIVQRSGHTFRLGKIKTHLARFAEEESPAAAPQRKGFFSDDSKWVRDEGWFSRRSREEQHRLAVEMAQCLPKREQTGQGDYAICISALYALVGHFGTEEAGAICLEAGWESDYWDPIERITTINSTPTNTIGTFIEKARQGGWRLQEEQLEAAPAPIPVERPITLEEMFPASVAADLRRITRYMPWPDTLIVTSYLTAVSAAVKMRCTIDLIGHTDFEVPLNLYHCVVGETGTMKTPAQKALITKPLAPLKKEIRGEHQERMKTWARLREEAGDGEDAGPPPSEPLLLISDTTMEAMEEQLMAQEDWGLPLLVLKDELAGWFASLDQYKGGPKGNQKASAQAKQMLEFFDGSGFITRRMGTSRYCDDSKLSISGAIQPEVLRGMQGYEDSDGQWARFLFSPLPAEAVRIPAKVSLEELNGIHRAEDELSAIPLRIHKLPPFALSLDDDAAELFAEHSYQTRLAAKRAMLPSHAAVLLKTSGKVGRIAGLLWLLDRVTDRQGERDVDVQFLQRAIRLVEHLDRYAMAFNQEANQTPEEKCRWRIHRNAGKAGGWQKLKVLRDNCTRQEKGDFPMVAMKKMAEDLAAAGYGEVRTTTRGGLEYRHLMPKGGSGG